MRQLILIRHPATDMAGTFCGHSDPDLNAVGRTQLQALQRRLDRVALDRILGSDLLRARRCAETLATQHGIGATLSPAFREMHFGNWEGLRWEELQARFPELAQRWLQEFATVTPPDGEPYAHFTARIGGQVDEFLQDTSCATLALVTHRGVLQFMLQTYCGVDSTAAWQLSSRYASALFCARAAGTDSPLSVREIWHPE